MQMSAIKPQQGNFEKQNNMQMFLSTEIKADMIS